MNSTKCNLLIIACISIMSCSRDNCEVTEGVRGQLSGTIDFSSKTEVKVDNCTCGEQNFRGNYQCTEEALRAAGFDPALANRICGENSSYPCYECEEIK